MNVCIIAETEEYCVDVADLLNHIETEHTKMVVGDGVEATLDKSYLETLAESVELAVFEYLKTRTVSSLIPSNGYFALPLKLSN